MKVGMATEPAISRGLLSRISENGGDAEVSGSVIQPDAVSEIQRQAKAFGFQEAVFFPASEIVTARWVEMKCRYGCANYNTSWCCPPAAPDLKATRELIGEYRVALLLVGPRRDGRSYGKPEARRREQIQIWKATVKLERKLFLMGYYRAFGMCSGPCALCKECRYPGPCKFPNEKRPSIEACSIDVFQTAKTAGRSPCVVCNTAEEYENYSLLLVT